MTPQSSTSHPIPIPQNLAATPTTSAKIGAAAPEEEGSSAAADSNGHNQNRKDEKNLGSLSRLRLVSLRTKATLVATLLGFVPVLGVGGIAFLLADPVITQQVARTKETETIQLADKLTRFMVERSANASTLATLPTSFLSGEQLNLSQDQQQILIDQFTRFVQDYLVFDSIVLLDPNGQIVIQSRGTAPETNLQNQPFFQRVLATRQTAISEPTPFAADTQNPLAIYLGAPVLSQQGQVIGVISARMPVDFLGNNVLRTGGLSEESAYRLIDSNGNIFQNFQDPNGLGVGQAAVDVLPLFPQIRELAATRSWISEDGSDLNAFTPMGPVAQLDWGVVTSTPTEIAFAAQNQLLLALVVGTLVTALGAALVGAYLARIATRPVIEAANAVKRIGQGDLTARTQIAGQDELSILGSNINRMADQIQAFLQSSEENTQRLQQQTQILADLAKQKALVQGDLKTVSTRITETIAQALQFDQVAVWLSVGGKPKCIDAFLLSTMSHSSGGIPSPAQLQAFTETAQSGQPLTQTFEDPAKITALLAIPIQLSGRVVGVIYCEQNRAYLWSLEEQVFVGSVANLVSLCLEAMERIKAQAQLQTSEQQQRQAKEALQQRAMELLMEVDPVSEGDLRIRARVTPDEIGTIADSYNSIIANLRDIVLQVQEATRQVNQTASGSEQAVRILSAEATAQADSLTQALDQIQVMVDSIQSVARRAQEAQAQVAQTNQVVKEGDTAMNRTVNGILGIRDTVAETTKKVKRLGETSQKISRVVSLINNFAAQTNLLSLNASIEASRAGEQGKGFAVVAEEVRSLAQQSSAATSEIEQLVDAIQRETNEVVSAMESGTDQVVIGTELVEAARQKLSQIATATAQISGLVQDIAAAAATQSQTSTEVGQTIEKVTGIAKQTSAQSITVAQSFEQLLKVAQELQVSVAQFKVGSESGPDQSTNGSDGQRPTPARIPALRG